MKRKLIGLFAFLFIGDLYADAPLVKVNCDNVKISTMTIGKNNFSFYAYWTEPTDFPNPPKEKSVGKSSTGSFKPFRFECPDISASFDGNMAEIKSVDLQTAVSKLGKYNNEIDLYHYSFYRYPNIRQGLITRDYTFDLNTFDLKSGIYTLKEGDDLRTIAFAEGIQKQSIIGYRIDGGDLKPLLYDKKVSSYKSDFEQAGTIDLYHKLHADDFGIGANIERIFLDKTNGVIRLYIKSTFPSK